MSEPVASQAELPLPAARPNRFVIPEDPVVNAPDGKPSAPAAAKAAAENGTTPVQNNEEQAPSAAPEGDKPETESKEPNPEEVEAKRAGRRIERKLDKAYRQRAEAQARAEFLEREVERLKQPTNAAVVQSGEPTLEQFGFDPEKYAAAKADHAKTQVAREFQAKQQTVAQQDAQRKLISSWEEKVEKAADKYDDFDTVVGDLKPNSPMLASIMEADNGPDIAHYLAKHMTEAERIARLPVLTQIREIGKLEAKLAAEPVKPKTPSKAPAPITPVTGAAPVSAEETLNDPSLPDSKLDAWMKMRNKKVAARR